jgi:glycyl-tRNA synthetase
MPCLLLCRLVLAILTSAYREEEVEGERRVVLALHPAIAPVKVCVLPLLKNNSDLMRMAHEVFDGLKAPGQWNIEMDGAGTIGKRYRRADEIGTPFCVTVDVDSLHDRCVTLRHRDSMEQERVPVDELRDKLEKYLRWR